MKPAVCMSDVELEYVDDDCFFASRKGMNVGFITYVEPLALFVAGRCHPTGKVEIKRHENQTDAEIWMLELQN